MKKPISPQERRRASRKKFGYYMPVLENETGRLVGHLVDISPDGLQLETSTPLSVGEELSLYIELTPEVSDRLFLFFSARTKWVQPDEIMPNFYHVGFEITHIEPDAHQTYLRLIETYGE